MHVNLIFTIFVYNYYFKWAWFWPFYGFKQSKMVNWWSYKCWFCDSNDKFPENNIFMKMCKGEDIQKTTKLSEKSELGSSCSSLNYLLISWLWKNPMCSVGLWLNGQKEEKWESPVLLKREWRTRDIHVRFSKVFFGPQYNFKSKLPPVITTSWPRKSAF